MACSTIELARELVDVLQKEAKQPRKLERYAFRTQVYSSGGVGGVGSAPHGNYGLYAGGVY